MASYIRMLKGKVSSDSLSGYLLLAPALIYLGIFFIYPIVQLFALSIFDPHYTLEHFIRAFGVSIYNRVLLRTIYIASTVTIICMLLAYPISALLSFVKPVIRFRLMVLILIPFWTSILIRTFSWMVILQREGLVNNALLSMGITDEPLVLMYDRFGVLVGMTHVLLPYFIFPLFAVMVGIDANLIKAALTLGANPLQAFIRVYLPLSFPGIAAGSLLVFILSLGFFITPALMGGPQDYMIAQLIERQIRFFLNWGFGSALSIILVISTILLFIVAARWLGIKRIWGGL